MFEESIAIIKDTFSQYWGTGMCLVVFLVALLYIYLKEENKKIKCLVLYFPITVLIVTLNPIFCKLLENVFTQHTYWRVFWMLPVGIVISYSVVKLISDLNEKKKKVVTFASILVIIIISGKNIYNEENFLKLGNLYKLPDESVLVAQLIGADENQSKRAIVPETLVAHIRQIDSSIKLAYKREPTIGYGENPIVRELNAGNVEGVMKIAHQLGCNYVVYKKATVLVGNMEDYGYEKLNETTNYAIYKFVGVNK